VTDDTVSPEKRPRAALSWAALVAASSPELRRIFHDSPDGCGGFAHPSWRPSRGYKCDRLAALAATSSPEPGLDVDRLARALFAVHPLMYPQSWPDDDPDDIGSDPTEDATAIAAEYARLASENRSA
jgi:hypothetical protein